MNTKLLKKEFRLAMHPTCLIFMTLSAMLLIPNYPYYVTFFYTGLALFFTCLSGRENSDTLYMMLLPVRKRDTVKARFLLVVTLETAQFLLAVPFAALRSAMALPGNQVGMDANLAFFGLALIQTGIFNLLFLTRYYRAPEKVGKAFAIASTGVFGYMLVAEAAAHVVPFVRDVLDTPDPAHLPEKLVVLAVGLVGYTALTLVAYNRSVKSFEMLDL